MTSELARVVTGLRRLPVKQGTPEWLAMRRTGVTASDLPVLMGNRDGLVRLWAEKCGIVEPEPVDAATQEMYDLGHALEPVIAARYTVKTGRPLRVVNAMVRHASIPWAFASLDRVSATPGERIVVELKWVPHYSWRSSPETVPAAVQDQVQWQMLVTGYPLAHVVVLVGSRVEWHEVPADPAYQDAQVRVASWFRGLVERRERPDIDGSESTRALLTTLYPADTEPDLLEPTAETDALAAEWRAARAAAKAAEAEESRLANVARAVLEAHPGVESDWYRLTWRRNRDSERTDWKAVAADLFPAVDRGAWDAAVKEHTTTVEGARVLRPWYRDEETGKWT